MFYTAIVRPDDGALVVTFPDAPGCVTQVDRAEHLMPMATDALAGWLDATLDAGDPVPVPRDKRRAPRGSWSVHVPVTPTVTALRVMLRQARTAEGLSQAALAQRLGVSTTTVRALERGRANPTLAMVDRVQTALDRSASSVAVNERAGAGYRGRHGRGAQGVG